MNKFYEHTCACGCGQKIEIKYNHKYTSIPKYVYNHHKKGKKQTQEVIEKRIAPLRGQKRTLEQRLTISNSLKGKPKSEIHKLNTSKSKLGKKNPKLSIVMKDKIPWNKGISMEDRMGEKNPNWRGGTACLPYCPLWSDKEYKESIKERDDFKCLNPLCDGKENKLHIHHINYDKKDCRPSNLITLCGSCNSKANFNRDWHQCWYEAILYRRYNIN